MELKVASEEEILRLHKKVQEEVLLLYSRMTAVEAEIGQLYRLIVELREDFGVRSQKK